MHEGERKMTMREAFEIYFNKLDISYQERYGTHPRVVYRSECDKKGIYIEGTQDDRGYAQWKPVLQDETVDFEDLENELGFTIHPHIKQYFTTYWFMQLAGNRGEDHFFLTRIEPNTEIKELIRECYEKGNIDYMKPGVFCAIGDAEIEGNQDCGLYVNNDTGEVIYVDWDEAGYYDFEIPFTETSFKVADSLMDLIKDLQR